MSNFHPVVGRGSETQLKVGENLNFLNERFKGSYNELLYLLQCTNPDYLLHIQLRK